MRWIVSLVCVCAFAAPARADLASSLYGDVRDVIEELIQTEVTGSVVGTIEDRSPALAFYMHGTLERLASPYWGSLGRVLKDDLTVAIADFVYWHVSTGGGDGDVVASARAFFACAKKGNPTSDACKRLLDAIAGQKRPLVEVECRRAKPPADRRVACHVGLAVLAALKGRGEVRQHLVDALAEIVLSEISEKPAGGRMRDVLTAWVDLPKDLPTPLIEALANPDLDELLSDEALEQRCGNFDEVKNALEDPNGAFSWICFAVTHKKLEDNLVATVTVREGPYEFKHAIPHWEIAKAIRDIDSDRFDDDSAFRLFAELAWDVECPPGNTSMGACNGKRFEPGAVVTVEWLHRNKATVTLGKDGKFFGAQKGFLTSPIIKFRRLARRMQELRALVPPSLAQYLFYAGQSVSPDTKSTLRAAHRMARLVAELRARWYLWSDKKQKGFDELDIAELLQVARASLDKTSLAHNTSLAFLDQHATGGAAKIDIGDWLRMVMRADYRSLAMESLRAALDLKLADHGRPHETFFLSLAAYLLDTNEGVGEQVARAAFRSSAKELLLSAQHRGVPRVGDRFRFRFLPRLSACLSFNDTYATTDGDSRRRVVAADFPTMMFAINDYVGLELSAIDFIAPLAEMALRPAGKYDKYANVALDLIRPRLGTWIAVPQISRRVALTAGFGARFLDVKRLDDGSDPKMLKAEYRYKASLTFDAGIQFVF
jgi:hypothetical protein